MPNQVENSKYDHLEIRCPRLGGEVTFSYCRVEGGNLPCPRILICWHPYFPVEAYLRKHLTQTQWDRLFNQPPKDKMATLVELIAAAKKRKDDSD